MRSALIAGSMVLTIFTLAGAAEARQAGGWYGGTPPRSPHYQDHRNDPQQPQGPRSPGYQNPYFPNTAPTPPRGPTVNSSGQNTRRR